MIMHPCLNELDEGVASGKGSRVSLTYKDPQMYMSKGEKRSRFQQQMISRANHIGLIDIQDIPEWDDFELVSDMKNLHSDAQLGHRKHGFQVNYIQQPEKEFPD
jgi:hypothetical protein